MDNEAATTYRPRVVAYYILLIFWTSMSIFYLVRSALNLPLILVMLIPYAVLLVGVIMSILGVQVILPLLKMDLSIWTLLLSLVFFDHAVLSQFEWWNRIKYILAIIVVVAGAIYYYLTRRIHQRH